MPEVKAAFSVEEECVVVWPLIAPAEVVSEEECVVVWVDLLAHRTGLVFASCQVGWN